MQILSARHVKTEESLRLGVVSGWYSHQGQRHLRHRPAHHAGRLPVENRRAQSGAGQEEVLTGRPLNRGGPTMALTRGDFREYDFNRMVVVFTMKNDQANVACAISTDAMDQLEGIVANAAGAARAAIPAAARPHRGTRGAEIQRRRTGGQSARRDPARDRFPRGAEVTGPAARSAAVSRRYRPPSRSRSARRCR